MWLRNFASVLSRETGLLYFSCLSVFIWVWYPDNEGSVEWIWCSPFSSWFVLAECWFPQNCCFATRQGRREEVAFSGWLLSWFVLVSCACPGQVYKSLWDLRSLTPEKLSRGDEKMLILRQGPEDPGCTRDSRPDEGRDNGSHCCWELCAGGATDGVWLPGRQAVWWSLQISVVETPWGYTFCRCLLEEAF